MRLHILGVCGTFMAGIAVLAKQAGHTVFGSDQHVYPPMSTQLKEQGIQLLEGYDPKHLDDQIDQVIIGNVMRRGMPIVEHILAHRIPYISGPAWLRENLLKDRTVLAVAGTHGKTTTTSLLTWILESAGLNPGFLIGGVPENFGFSARIGSAPYFVIEADEYDTAFFDKRSKFVHYHPTVAILNNLEFDHADIFPNLDAIKDQFHGLVRTIPNNGLILKHAAESHLTDVLNKGCWTPVATFGGEGEWQARLHEPDGSAFSVLKAGQVLGEVSWQLVGQHNVDNALAAIAAAVQVGVSPQVAASVLSTFKNVKRRLEVKGVVNQIVIYDDFAHHPTAIAKTLAGLRARIGKARLIAVLEFGSYTMRTGVHKDQLQAALTEADVVVCQAPAMEWGLKEVLIHFKQPTQLYDNIDNLIKSLAPQLHPEDHVVIMSNSHFGGIHGRLLDAIAAQMTTS